MDRSSLTVHWLATGRVRRSTLLTYRWIAMVGQGVTLVIVHFGLGLPIPFFHCLGAIAVAGLVNLWLAVTGRGKPMVEEPIAVMSLGFDLVQIALLLFLTGGVKNPFAMMILAPITVSATVLTGVSTAILSSLAIGMVWTLTAWHWPSPVPEIAEEEIALQAVGLWVALSLTVVFVAGYTWRVAQDARRLSAALAATATALAREQRVASVGALAAAVAHDLGTPLATIAVAAKELSHTLPPGSDAAEDVAVILAQSERCRHILGDLSYASTADDDDDEDEHQPFFAATGLTNVVRTTALPWDSEQVPIRVTVGHQPQANAPEPVITKDSAAIRRGLGLFLQNAAQFARSAVSVTVSWSEAGHTVAIEDDGPGFPPDVLSRLGEPFVSGRSDREGHMGLGIFIAVTLLRRSGASVRFENRHPGDGPPSGNTVTGARVVIIWPAASAEAKP